MNEKIGGYDPKLKWYCPHKSFNSIEEGSTEVAWNCSYMVFNSLPQQMYPTPIYHNHICSNSKYI